MKKILLLALFLPVCALAQKPYTSNAQLIPNYTVATLPPSTYTGNIVLVTDGNGNSCTSGGSSSMVFCRYSGSAWVAIAGNGSGGGAVDSVTGTSNQITCSPTTGSVVCGVSSPLVVPGLLEIQAGSASAPSLTFAGVQDLGFYQPSGGATENIALTIAGEAKVLWSNVTMRMRNSGILAWSSGDAVSGSTDTSLTRSSAGVVSVNAGASGGQGSLIFGNGTMATTVGSATANSPTLTMSGVYQNSATPTYAADTYTFQDVCSAGLNGACVFTILHSGTSGASRVSFFSGPFINATSIVAPSSGSIVWNGRSQFQSPADGIVELLNSAASDFNRLQFGGTTASFPALKRSSAGLIARLADDSADTTFEASRYLTESNCSSSASPAVCGSASAGSVVVAASATTVVVDTTAVTANSLIFIQYDSSLGTKLGVTCNATVALPAVTARSAGASFTITVPVAPVTNPACYSYWVVN